MKWKNAEKYKPKKHKANSLFSVNVILSFGENTLKEPNIVGYYNFYDNKWEHQDQYVCMPVAFLEYPEFTGEF